MSLGNLWLIDKRQVTNALPALAVEKLLETMESRALARGLLEFLQTSVPVDYIAVYSYPAGAAPVMLDGESALGDDIMRGCFQTYRRRFACYDRALAIAERLRCARDCPAPICALRYRSDQIPDPAWRREIYQRNELCERLTFLFTPVRGRVIGLNLFRRATRGRFGDGELEQLSAYAPVLSQISRLLLRPRLSTGTASERIALFEHTAALRFPELTLRERQVCARIAAGITNEGIAVQLGIAPSSVHTLRKRAYARLGICDRLRLSELLG